ncbi:JAB domain-containing protein [Polluticoccus soli]|uniref:JAB domain-containing protein n=1 Tax=Polluticoccus soli TaxID=3034150 RepID=UPI0023E1A8B3|nr:JAB domain-containing protein [Flavipsychrobacter sp. JY13-12]
MEQLYKLAEIKVRYNRSTRKEIEPLIKGSDDAITVLRKFYSSDTIELQEQFIVLYLNRANQVIGVYKMSTGGITGTIADIRIMLGVALQTAASSIIMSHNHPSGNLIPSGADKELTKKMSEACRYMDIKLLDHLILSAEGYHSMAEDGLTS